MLIIKEIHENATERHLIGEEDWFEPFTDNLGELFRALQREHGACTSKVFQDVPDGTAFPCGWYFRKKRAYEDAPDRFYLHGVWVLYKRVAG